MVHVYTYVILENSNKTVTTIYIGFTGGTFMVYFSHIYAKLIPILDFEPKVASICSQAGCTRAKILGQNRQNSSTVAFGS